MYKILKYINSQKIYFKKITHKKNITGDKAF